MKTVAATANIAGPDFVHDTALARRIQDRRYHGIGWAAEFPSNRSAREWRRLEDG